MTRIGFIACPGTLPDAPVRRKDGPEHDRQVAALQRGLAAHSIELDVIDWHAGPEAFDGLPLALIGTPWDYQDEAPDFLAKLDLLAARGIAVHNPPDLVRWNIDKSYLKDLAKRGAPTIPTVWAARPTAADIAEAFERFDCDEVVVKRQIGAGAEGQHRFHRSAPPVTGWSMDRAAMIQPLIPAIATEGEFSFVFVDGNLSHALLKCAAPGDYRIQSVYGGKEIAHEPTAAETGAAREVLEAIPFPTPLYARIDMVRGPDGNLLLMEAELIEPYLYPEQGQRLGDMMAAAIATRLGRKA